MMESDNLLRTILGPRIFENFVAEISSFPRIFRGVGKDFVDLLTIEEIDHLVSIAALRPPFISLINGATGVDSSDYPLYLDFSIKCANPSKILTECFKHGTTIIIQHIHVLHPRVRAFVEGLRESLHPMSIQTNCYLTPSNSQGVFPHVDQHHTFLFQLEGKKNWSVWENIDNDPSQPMINSGMDPSISTKVAENSRPILNEWIEPGDFILIPRGFVHTPYTGNSTSMHITFGIMDPGDQTAAELFYRRLSTESNSLNFSKLSLAKEFCNNQELEKKSFFPPLDFVEVI